MHRTAPRRSSIRALALGALVTVAATRPAPGVTANGVFAVSGLPGLEAISLRQIGSALHMCAIAGPDIVKAADGTIDVASGAFTLQYVPAVLGPGGLGAYCSITVSGTVAADGMSLTGTQTEHSTCVPPPFTCVPGCVLSATLPFTGTRTSATPAPCCGDAFPNPGEQCDDGNDATGDCCAPDCTPEPAGGTCPDAFDDPCTTTTCDGFGHCLHENSCAHQPLVGTKLLLKRAGTREKLVWLAKDPSLAVPALGGPDDPS